MPPGDGIYMINEVINIIEILIYGNNFSGSGIYGTRTDIWIGTINGNMWGVATIVDASWLNFNITALRVILSYGSLMWFNQGGINFISPTSIDYYTDGIATM